MSLAIVIAEFESILDGISAVFIDAREGFQLLQAKVEADASGINWSTPIFYGDGPQGSAETVLLATTIEKRIGRNACDGENCTFVANMAVVSIYGHWEDHYRSRIASVLQQPKNELKSDVFGDIGKIRNAIVHNKARAPKGFENHCKVLTWFSEGDEIFLSQDMFVKMMREIHQYLQFLLRGNCH